jgi:hypothetical protein
MMDMKTIAAIILGLVLTSSIVFASNKGNEKENDKAVETSTIAPLALSGKVVDLTTGEALAGVTLKIDGTEHVAYSDFDGNFCFNNVITGSVNIIANFISYEKTSVNISSSNIGNIQLKLKAIE